MDFTSNVISNAPVLSRIGTLRIILERKQALKLLVSILLGRYRNYDVFLKFKCDHVTHANRHLCVCYKH